MNNYIICKPVMLGANQSTLAGSFNPIWLEESWFPNHLYLMYDEMIKEDDWWWNRITGIHKATKQDEADYSFCTKEERKNLLKIIATTDKSLGLPLISQSFIDEYVQKQGKIDVVRILMHNSVYHKKLEPSINKNGVIILPVEEKIVPESRVIALMSATANHVRKNGYGGHSISHVLAHMLYDRWQNKKSEEFTDIPTEDKMYNREEVKTLYEKWSKQCNTIHLLNWMSFSDWLDKNYSI